MAVQVGEIARYVRGDDAAEYPFGRFQNRHVHAELAGNRRHFEADVSGADDDDAVAGLQVATEPGGIEHRPERDHAGQVDAGDRQRPGAHAGGQEQLVVVENHAVLEPDAVMLAIELGGGDADMQLHLKVLVERGGTQQQPLLVGLAG